MDRRDALKSLATLAGATGLTVTPITEQQAERAALLVVRCDGYLSMDTRRYVQETMTQALKDTRLAGTKVIVLDKGMTLELVTK